MTDIRYIDRTRDYYRAQGFDRDYQWATNAQTPLQVLSRPLAECAVALVTTAVVDPSVPKPVRCAASYPMAEVPDSFDTAELSWDKETTHTRDRGSYFPLEALQELAAEGRIGSLATRYHFVPTEYSQRHTIEQDAPAIVDACRADGVDVALLVPI